MGEVWRARHTVLKRDDALKVLPKEFAADPERLARFHREAQVLASLSHPNIAHVYGLEESSHSASSGHAGVQALVMELVEGPTLADRIAQGPIALDEALPIAKQIAEALEAAHEQGIIHRDLKPANIKVRPDGTVKVLDFGLARIMDPLGGTSPDMSQSPTITSPAMTGVGMLLGTAAYMSPEQAKGRAADRRSDIWAFGCVLYEMLAAKRAFGGGGVTETLAFIITKEPDWNALPPDTPTAIHRLLRRSLEKDVKRRLPDIGVARLEIDEAAGLQTLTIPTRRSRRGDRSVALWKIATALASVAAVAMAGVYLSSVTSSLSSGPSVPIGAPVRFTIAPPPNTSQAGDRQATAVSPDGRKVAFVASQEGTPLLWVRSLDGAESISLAGTTGAGQPFWSPDSRRLGFNSPDGVKIIDASGGPVRVIANSLPGGLAGAAWNADNVIVLGSIGGGLFRVSPEGGELMPLTIPDDARGERAHRYPAFLPDAEHLLYRAMPSSTIWLVSLRGGAPTRLLSADSQAYIDSGRLLFVRQNTLVAQPFDVRRLMLTGEATAIAQQILPQPNGVMSFSASGAGVIAFRTGTQRAPAQLTWFDRAGDVTGTVGQRALYRSPTLSPDGTRIAVEMTDEATNTQDIAVIDVARGVTTRLTFHPANDIYPMWSPNGESIVFGSDRARRGIFNLYQKRANGTDTEQLLLESSTDMAPLDWSPDGQSIVYRAAPNLGILPLFGDRTPRLFEKIRFNQSFARVSPDGRWIAYRSQEMPRNEVYVESFPAPGGGKWQVSANGGTYPRWRRDGRELFYHGLDGRLMAVPVSGGQALEFGVPTALFDLRALGGPLTPLIGGAGFLAQYDVSRDGRFLVNVPVEDTSGSAIHIIVNWPAMLADK
jgi:serine/threonine protein kinase/Tol biopolymer transport system component